MGGLLHVDLRTNDSLTAAVNHGLHEAAFPDTLRKHVRLRLATHDVTVYWWIVDSKGGRRPLTVLDVIDSIRGALKMPIRPGVTSPGHLLNRVVAAACVRRWGRTPRNMDLYGPAERLVLVRLVLRRDASGSYHDVDLLPLSHLRAWA